MEEKEPIKVSLQTVLLIFAIIIILIMAIIIGVLYNKNKKIEDNGSELENISRVDIY